MSCFSIDDALDCACERFEYEMGFSQHRIDRCCGFVTRLMVRVNSARAILLQMEESF